VPVLNGVAIAQRLRDAPRHPVGVEGGGARRVLRDMTKAAAQQATSCAIPWSRSELATARSSSAAVMCPAGAARCSRGWPAA